MRTLLRLSVLALTLLPMAAAADLVVVVNANSGVERLSRDEVINIFLGRYRQFANGAAALPIDQPAGPGEKAQFYRQLVGKELAEINAYWSRLVFSGKTSPPRQAANAREVLDWLGSQPGAVGYLDRERVDPRLRIVLDLAP
jgi:ABC-type phosphate transport system substrate-binding protein